MEDSQADTDLNGQPDKEDSAKESVLEPTFLADKSWWKQALKCALAFAPFCYVPAFVLALADIIVLLTVEHLNHSMNAVLITPIDLWQSAALGLLSSALSFLLTIWAFWAWLCRLTAFCHALAKTTGVPTKVEFQQALDHVSHHQVFFAKVWMFASLYVLLPAVPLCFFILLNTVSAPELTSLHLTNFALPAWLMMLASFVCFVLTAIAAGYSFVVFVVSAANDNFAPDQAAQVAKYSFQLFWKHFYVFAGVSALVLLSNVLVTRPMALWSQTSLELTKLQIGFETCWQIWFAIASVILWSLSLTPFCQLVKMATEKE